MMDIVNKFGICPTCKRPFKIRYWCKKCKKPILKMHKWHRIPDDKYNFHVEHRNCDDPESYK